MRQEMRAKFDAHHEEMMAEMKAGHEEMMAQTGFLASSLDSYQAKTEASLEDLTTLMGVSLEKKAKIEIGHEPRKAKIKRDLEELKTTE
jgi:hypothetical protein